MINLINTLNPKTLAFTYFLIVIENKIQNNILQTSGWKVIYKNCKFWEKYKWC